ncbi:MAG: hypothetical protein JW947_03215 [Sedimentisphaerales bacterium]|nr:hypothetical protein [Sedimentisphaerales bacterium]
MEKEEKLLELYKLTIEQENYFLSEHQHRVAFYIGLISALLAGTVAGVFQSYEYKWYYFLLLLLGPISIAVVSCIAIKGADRLYQRFLESITMLKKVEHDLGLAKRRDGNPSEEGDWIANETFTTERHRLSIGGLSSYKWVQSHMRFSLANNGKRKKRNYNGIAVFLFKATYLLAIILSVAILIISSIKYIEQN